MSTRLSKLSRSLALSAVAVLLISLLAACGEMPVTGTEVVPPASPIAPDRPVETFRATAAIVNEVLEPDDFAGTIGTAFELVISGDGIEHTFAIDQLVDERTIAATGETTVGFTIEGEPGELTIWLDGEPAGTFRRQTPEGATSP